MEKISEVSEVKVRVMKEQGELEDKINALYNFIVCDIKYMKLTKAQQYLLQEQLDAMNTYNNILLARLSIMD